ncbi:Transcriptional adapter 1 [Chelonia mydas]|uniref:Transcriptional adapter 1 n=1 Tax=Chelonia mydas TaxID=8469 RepID=M7BG06_CHEMY|nr:Transcriptional adapter 1 [Chelonia mydas]
MLLASYLQYHLKVRTAVRTVLLLLALQGVYMPDMLNIRMSLHLQPPFQRTCIYADDNPKQCTPTYVHFRHLIHSHNDFLLAILTRCQILVSAPEGPGPLPWTGGSAAKPGKPKGKKKFSSVRQKFDHRFQPQNPLSGAQQFVAKDPQEDDDLKLCSHTMMLPTRGQLEGRMIVTAYEHGLDNVTEEAVTAIVYAVQNHLKDILASVVSRRKAYRLRDGHFKYAFGSNVNPQPYLKNSVVAYNNLIECPPTCVAPSAGQNLASHPAPDDAEQQAALLLACSGNTLPATLPPVNMYDLFEALQVHREVVPAHTVYALNIERIIMKLWHPNHEELQQDKIHRQRLAAKEGLLLC